MKLIEEMSNYILDRLDDFRNNHEEILSLEKFYYELEVQNENFKNCFEMNGNFKIFYYLFFIKFI